MLLSLAEAGVCTVRFVEYSPVGLQSCMFWPEHTPKRHYGSYGPNVFSLGLPLTRKLL